MEFGESSNQFRLNCSKDDFIKKSNYFLNHILGEKRGLKRVCEEDFSESTKISKMSPSDSKLMDTSADKINLNNSGVADHKPGKSQTKLFEILSNKKVQNKANNKTRTLNDQTENMSISNTFRRMVRNHNQEDSKLISNSMKEFLKLAQDSVAESKSSEPLTLQADKNNNIVEPEKSQASSQEKVRKTEHGRFIN